MTTSKTENRQRSNEKMLRDQLREAERKIADIEDALHDAEAREPEDYGDLRAALVSLHEQAHGQDSIRFCQAEPCRSIDAHFAGPAPHVLIP